MEQYADVQQLMKREDGQNRKPIYPPTVIQAVFDGKTGASLEAILAQFNSVYVQYQGTPEATRNIIPKEMRRAGLTITYMDMDSNTITERANSAVQKDNDHWALDVNWIRVDELSLSGDISVSAKGTWIINGTDTGVKAVGPKGDTGLTPWLKTIDNKLHFSYDNVTWEPCSENIAAWFRWSGNKIQISRDNKTWTDLSGKFADNVHIKGYVANYASLPSGAVQGDIYGVGPTYAAEDTARTNPIYRYYVRNANSWVDNGSFTSLSAGVVQETGNSETEVMSQKAVSEKLSELGSKVNDVVGIDYHLIEYQQLTQGYDYWGKPTGDEGVLKRAEIILSEGYYAFGAKMRSATYCLLVDSFGNIINRWNGSGIEYHSFKANEGDKLLLSALTNALMVAYKLITPSLLSDDLLEKITTMLTPQQIDIFEPRAIYGRKITNGSKYIKFNNSIFPEGFITDSDTICQIDGGREVVIEEMGKDNFKKKIHLSFNNGYEKDINIQVKNVNPSAITQPNKALVLCIGESTTANQSANPFIGSVSKSEGWNWCSMMRVNSIKDQIDGVGADVVTLGTCGPDWSIPITYKEQTKELQSAYIGHGGWSSYTYLNWPCSCKLNVGLSSSWFTNETMWYILGLATKTPYNQETYNTERTEYNGSAEQLATIAKTPFGKYKADGSSVLWGFLKVISGKTDPSAYTVSPFKTYPIFNGTGEYTGSAEQTGKINEWAVELAQNPINELYDYNTAKKQNYAVSVPKLIERYRTMDENGVRLVCSDENPSGVSVRGSDGNLYTIGTRIVNQTLLKYINICNPTHVVINLGINEEDSDNDVASSLLCYKRLFNSFGSIPLAHFVFRHPGVLELGAWSDMYISRKYPMTEGQKKLINLLTELYSWVDTDTQGDKTALDVWHTQFPASQYHEKKCDSGDYPTTRIDCSYNDVHCGYFAQKSAAWQVLHWLYSKLSYP